MATVAEHSLGRDAGQADQPEITPPGLQNIAIHDYGPAVAKAKRPVGDLEAGAPQESPALAGAAENDDDAQAGMEKTLFKRMPSYYLFHLYHWSVVLLVALIIGIVVWQFKFGGRL